MHDVDPIRVYKILSQNCYSPSSYRRNSEGQQHGWPHHPAVPHVLGHLHVSPASGHISSAYTLDCCCVTLDTNTRSGLQAQPTVHPLRMVEKLCEIIAFIQKGFRHTHTLFLSFPQRVQPSTNSTCCSRFGAQSRTWSCQHLTNQYRRPEPRLSYYCFRTVT